MGTRASIRIKDQFGCELWFIRPYDGFPGHTMPSLQRLMGWVRAGHLRDCASEASTWLILLGIRSHVSGLAAQVKGYSKDVTQMEPLTHDRDVGSYQVTNMRHGDIDYLYELDLSLCTIACYSVQPKKDTLLFTDTPEEPWTSEKGPHD